MIKPPVWKANSYTLQELDVDSRLTPQNKTSLAIWLCRYSNQNLMVISAKQPPTLTVSQNELLWIHPDAEGQTWSFWRIRSPSLFLGTDKQPLWLFRLEDLLDNSYGSYMQTTYLIQTLELDFNTRYKCKTSSGPPNLSQKVIGKSWRIVKLVWNSMVYVAFICKIKFKKDMQCHVQ